VDRLRIGSGHMRRFALIGIGLVGLAGCGAGGLASPRVSPASTRSLQPTSGSGTTPTSGIKPSSTPTSGIKPSSTPTPEPSTSTAAGLPLAVLSTAIGLEAVDGSGRVKWTLTNANLDSQLGENGSVLGQVIAGPNLLVDFEMGSGPTTQDQLVVVNSSTTSRLSS
jgi:hypothetical protein